MKIPDFVYSPAVMTRLHAVTVLLLALQSVALISLLAMTGIPDTVRVVLAVAMAGFIGSLYILAKMIVIAFDGITAALVGLRVGNYVTTADIVNYCDLPRNVAEKVVEGGYDALYGFPEVRRELEKHGRK